MNAQEMFEISKAQYKSKVVEKETILPQRLINCLARNGYVKQDIHFRERFGKKNQACTINYEKLQEDVLNGKIWEVKNIGEKSIMNICEWLVNNDPQ